MIAPQCGNNVSFFNTPGGDVRDPHPASQQLVTEIVMNESILLDWDQVFQGQIPNLDFVFGGLLAGTVGGIIAHGGAGKSFLAMEVGVCLTAKDILGIGVEPKNCMVGYITAEDPMIVLQNRAFDIASHLSPAERERVKDFLAFYSLHGYTPSLISSKGERDDVWIEYLKGLAKNHRLLIIDTLRKFHQGEENDSGHMTLLTQVLDEIASQTGCAILFLHHVNKATMRDSNNNQIASRGSSALVDNIRFQLSLVNMTEVEASELLIDEGLRRNFVKLIGSKANYAESQNDHWLRRDKGGVLIPAVFDTPAKIEKAKDRKKEESEIEKSSKINEVDLSDSSIDKGNLTYRDIFG